MPAAALAREEMIPQEQALHYYRCCRFLLVPGLIP